MKTNDEVELIIIENVCNMESLNLGNGNFIRVEDIKRLQEPIEM